VNVGTPGTVPVASAPVSFGIFELTLDRTPLVGPDRLLELVAAAGYAGVDLGPVGYLGDARWLPARLSAHGLGLAGGWVPLSFGDAVLFERELTGLEDTLDLFVAAAGDRPDVAPKPTLADAGSAARRRTLVRRRPSGQGMGDDEWSRFAARIDGAARRHPTTICPAPTPGGTSLRRRSPRIPPPGPSAPPTRGSAGTMHVSISEPGPDRSGRGPTERPDRFRRQRGLQGRRGYGRHGPSQQRQAQEVA